MRKRTILALAGVAAVVLVAALIAWTSRSGARRDNDSRPWPTAGWQHAVPEAHGLDSTALAAMFDAIDAEGFNIHSVLIARHGVLLLDAYRYPYTPDTPHELRSVTKSVLSALVGIALDRGYLASLDRSVLGFFPERSVTNADGWKADITLAHLLSMTSGFDWPDDASESTTNMLASDDWVQFVLDKPMKARPGTRFKYNNGGAHLVSAILAIKTGMDPAAFARETLFDPLGIGSAAWQTDPDGLAIGGWGLSLTPRDLAKIGYLYLNNGRWNGKQIMPAEWVADSTRDRLNVGAIGYGYLWWVHPQEGYYTAEGSGGQYLIVLPELDMVVVFTGGVREDRDFSPPQRLLAEHIIPAVQSADTLPANPSAAAALEARALAFASPAPRPVPDLPALASAITGQPYTLGENSFGWDTLTLAFEAGSATADLILNDDAPLPVGLDDVPRITAVGPDTLGLRGAWVDGSTFVIERQVIGAPEDVQIALVFDGDRVTITLVELTTGSGERFAGTRAAP